MKKEETKQFLRWCIAVTRPVQKFIIVRNDKQKIHNDFTFILQGSCAKFPCAKFPRKSY